MSDKKNMKLFSLNSNPEIAQKIADHAGVPLGKISSRQFSDGEIQVNIEESVRGYDIYIIQSTSFPVNNHLMELLIMVDACQRASANTVNVVMPYFGYARQDRTAAPREPITAKLVANMLVKAGVDRVVTLDLHAVQVQGFFDIAVDNLFTIPLFAEHYINKGLTGPDVVVVSPKNSGVKRARSLAEYLDAPIAIIDYEQDDANRDYGYIIGDVKDKKAILIDDILNTGKTFSEAAKIVEREGATEIYAVSPFKYYIDDEQLSLKDIYILTEEDEKRLRIYIIDYGSDKITISIPCEVICEVEAAFNFSLWDSIDKEDVSFGGTRKIVEISYKTDVLVNLYGNFLDGLQNMDIDEIEVTHDSVFVDMGEISPFDDEDYGDEYY